MLWGFGSLQKQYDTVQLKVYVYIPKRPASWSGPGSRDDLKASLA